MSCIHHLAYSEMHVHVHKSYINSTQPHQTWFYVDQIEENFTLYVLLQIAILGYILKKISTKS